MKFKKLISAFAAIAMLSTMVASLTASAAISTTKPTINLSYGDYEVIEDGGTTYYDITVSLSYSGYDGYVAHSTSGRPAKSTVTGMSGYQATIALSGSDFYGYAAADHTAPSSSATKIAWNAGGFDSYRTADGALGSFTIETTNPDATTTLSFSDLKLNFFEITAGSVTGEFLPQYAGEVSIDIPSYNSTQKPAETLATIALTASEGAVANSMYYKAVVTPGTAEGDKITAANIDMDVTLADDTVKERIVELGAETIADIDGAFTFYIGNTWGDAKPAFTATANATAGVTGAIASEAVAY